MSGLFEHSENVGIVHPCKCTYMILTIIYYAERRVCIHLIVRKRLLTCREGSLELMSESLQRPENMLRHASRSVSQVQSGRVKFQKSSYCQPIV